MEAKRKDVENPGGQDFEPGVAQELGHSFWQAKAR
jgi:hypothetical protein